MFISSFDISPKYPHSLFSNAKVRQGHLSLSDQYGKLIQTISWLTLAQRADHFCADKQDIT